MNGTCGMRDTEACAVHRNASSKFPVVYEQRESAGNGLWAAGHTTKTFLEKRWRPSKHRLQIVFKLRDELVAEAVRAEHLLELL